LAEAEVRRACPAHYIWRVRLPFDEVAGPRNYLTKLAAFAEVWDQTNSVSHRADFARAALDLWEARAPWGTYHLVNPGALAARDVVQRMAARGLFPHEPRFIDNTTGSCRLSVAKALATGIVIRGANEALDDALTRWHA
jgi:dTDP-4-dehydrorhamnose reductase